MDWQPGVDADSRSLFPQIAEPHPDSPQKSPKDSLVKLLDQVEMHVERLRKDALKLEEERDTLLTTLDTIRNSEMMIDLSDSKYGFFFHSLHFDFSFTCLPDFKGKTVIVAGPV